MKKLETYMQHAIRLARREIGQTSPNPAVGSVIVHNGTIIGEGWHRKAGLPHAEREAIKDAQSKGFNDFRDAMIIVTLEPCSSQGKTGACCDAIIEHQFKKVVYGSTDQNPNHVGRAQKLLQQSGIEVVNKVLEEECDTLIRGFQKGQSEGLPWVIIKSAMSLDGKITRPKNEPQWLTNPESRQIVHQIRSEVDAIITGGATVRVDDPELSVRLPEYVGRQPSPVIMTRSKSSFSPDLKLIQNPETILYDSVEPLEVLRSLNHDHGVNTVLIEAGGRLIGEFIDAGLVDEVYFFLAPLLTGGPDLAVGGNGVGSLSERHHLTECTFKKIGDDLLLHGLISKNQDADFLARD